jgi:hypothetical protein
MNSASLCSLAGRYDNPIPPRFLAPTDSLKIRALAGRYENPIPPWYLAPIDFLKIPALSVGSQRKDRTRICKHFKELRARIFKRLWGPGIDSKE